MHEQLRTPTLARGTLALVVAVTALVWSCIMPANATNQPDQPSGDSAVYRGIAPDGPITDAQRAENLRVNQEKLNQVSQQRSAESGVTAAAVTSKYLGIHHSAEAHYYWCGPAAVRSALLQRSVDVTQTPLATQMRTTKAAGTAWVGVNADVPSPSGRPVRDVMNQREPGSWNYAAVDVKNDSSATQSTYDSNLKFNILANHPLVIGLYESPNGDHLTGHPASSAIWHYVSARGFSGSGSTTGIDDPASGSPEISWSGQVPAQSNVSSAKMIDMMKPHGGQGAYGYVW